MNFDQTMERFLYKNSFINMTDKGLSIGEKSFVSVYKNEIKNNNIGIALKDGSKSCLNQNYFDLDRINHIILHLLLIMTNYLKLLY